MEKIALSPQQNPYTAQSLAAYIFRAVVFCQTLLLTRRDAKSKVLHEFLQNRMVFGWHFNMKFGINISQKDCPSISLSTG